MRFPTEEIASEKLKRGETTLNFPNQYRQGDILFVEIRSLPCSRKKLGHGLIAEGEATGHKHEFIGETAELYADGSELFLDVSACTDIVHAEHKTIALPKGFYRIVLQREYAPQRVTNVRD